jgi:Protein of unknown function (DUF1579)
MRKTFLTICAAAFLIVACNSKKEDKTGEASKETSNEGKEPKAWIPVDSAMMMKAWQEGMTISDNHKMLAKTNGTWTGEVTMWMADGAPAQTSTSTSVTESIYGGLYSQTKHSGDMMGMPFHGMSIMGYDNSKKEFFSTWIDNMGSGVMVMTGQMAGKTINLSGNVRCMNGQDANMREVFTMVDDDHMTMEMYGPDPATGKEYKNMEIKYTRKN